MRRLRPIRTVARHGFGSFARGLGFLRLLNLHVHHDAREAFAHGVKKRFKHAEGFALIFLLRLFLRVASEINPLTQGVKRRDVLTPHGIQHLEKHVLCKARPGFVPHHVLFCLLNGVGGVMTGEDAAEFILAGATCVSVGMANFVDPCASLKIARELEAWAESQGVKDINELVGAFEC